MEQNISNAKMLMDLIKQKEWDDNYRKSNVIAPKLSDESPIIEWILSTAALCKNGRCLKIGVFPSKLINKFGKLNGIDLKLNEIFRLKSMNPKEKEDILIENNFKIVKQGYIGKFDFWTKQSPSYSPFCGIIAKKERIYL